MQNLMPPVDTPDKAFHDGNPLTGELGTIVTAKFMNDVQAAIRNSQAEIISVLADAGIAIDPNKTDQLLAALKSTFATNSNMNDRVPSTRTVNGKALSADITLNAGDVGAYTKNETDTRVASAVDNANSRVPSTRTINGKALSSDVTLSAVDLGALSASQNGADIQDKSIFAKNAQVPRLGGSWIEFGGSAGNWTTQQFINFLNLMGAFDHLYFVCAGTWSFSANKKISDTGCGHIELAGAVVEVFASRFNLKTVRVTTMSSSSDPDAVQGQYVYVESENPGFGEWRREFNTKSLTPAAIGAMASSELVGMPQIFPSAIAPTGWLKCNGQQFDTAQYPVLASRYPSGFLPDLRGEFVRGWDDGRSIDNGRALLSAQGDEFKSHAHGNVPLYMQSGDSDRGNSGFSWFSVDDIGMTETAGGNETRPRNIAFNYIVRAA